MSELKTTANDADPVAFINASVDGAKKEDSLVLLELYQKLTGEPPKMWGSSIIGFGQYHYKSERSSQEGDWPLAGFSPRKQNLSIYIMHGFDSYGDLLEKLGKHKTSKGCLYINKLGDVDIQVLSELITRGYKDMKSEHIQS